SGSGAVRYVTATHTIVLTTTVTSMVTAITRWSPSGYRATMNGCTAIDTMPEMIIALISDQALIRHQYQRRISTRPVPDPNASRNSHILATESTRHATTADRRKSAMVVHRETDT